MATLSSKTAPPARSCTPFSCTACELELWLLWALSAAQIIVYIGAFESSHFGGLPEIAYRLALTSAHPPSKSCERRARDFWTEGAGVGTLGTGARTRLRLSAACASTYVLVQYL